eukprot:TRINITY_DN27594_c0_g1_i2.p1 TRINITY_DN27594_c0_g1~~TRINITY_DN27594_c0_g1_i2.p1  ORF type:complete len:927 (-),score=213.80 TRINITY_DN27594_c0_g1_i2:755-3391(-)
MASGWTPGGGVAALAAAARSGGEAASQWQAGAGRGRGQWPQPLGNGGSAAFGAPMTPAVLAAAGRSPLPAGSSRLAAVGPPGATALAAASRLQQPSLQQGAAPWIPPEPSPERGTWDTSGLGAPGASPRRDDAAPADEGEAARREEKGLMMKRAVAKKVMSALDEKCRELVQGMCSRIRDFEERIELAKSCDEEWTDEREELLEQLKEMESEMKDMRQQMEAAEDELRSLRKAADAADANSVAIGAGLGGARTRPLFKMDMGPMDDDSDSPDPVKVRVGGRDRAWVRFLRQLRATWRHVEPLRTDIRRISSRFGRAAGGFFIFYRYLLLLSVIQLAIHMLLLVPHAFRTLSSGGAVKKCGSAFSCALFFGSFSAQSQNTMADASSASAAKDPWNALVYVVAVGASAAALLAMSVERWSRIDLQNKREDLLEGINPRRWSRLTLAAWDFKLEQADQRQDFSDALSQQVHSAFADEEEAEKANRRSLFERYVLLLRRVVGFLLSSLLILFAWVFIIGVTVREKDLTRQLERMLGVLPGRFKELAPVIGSLAPNLAISAVGGVLPAATKAITALEGWTPSVNARKTVWRLYWCKILNVVIVVGLNVERLAGRPLFRQDSMLTEVDASFACVEDQSAVELLTLVFSEFVLSMLPKPLVQYMGAYCTYLAMRTVMGKQDFHKPEFDMSENAVDVVYFQTLIWIASLLCPPILLVAPFMAFLHIKVLKFALLRLSSRPFASETLSFRVTLLELNCVSCMLFMGVVVAAFVQPLPHKASCGPFDSDVAPAAVIMSLQLPVLQPLAEALSSVSRQLIVAVAVLAILASTSRAVQKRAHQMALARLQSMAERRSEAVSLELSQVEKQVATMRSLLQRHEAGGLGRKG